VSSEFHEILKIFFKSAFPARRPQYTLAITQFQAKYIPYAAKKK
jgi:hypothetical protein